MPIIAGLAKWMVETLLSGILGLLIGGLLIPAVERIVAPAWKFAKARSRRG
jgi:hypothetical protein